MHKVILDDAVLAALGRDALLTWGKLTFGPGDSSRSVRLKELHHLIGKGRKGQEEISLGHVARLLLVFGLIDADVYGTLAAVNKLRNSFAHKPLDGNLEDSSTRLCILLDMPLILANEERLIGLGARYLYESAVEPLKREMRRLSGHPAGSYWPPEI